MIEYQEFCETCEAETTQVSLGLIPSSMLTGDTNEEHGHTWNKSLFCTNCGTLYPVVVTDEEQQQADEKYIRLLVKHGLMTEEQAKEDYSVEV